MLKPSDHSANAWKICAERCTERSEPLGHVVVMVPRAASSVTYSPLQVNSFIELITMLYACRHIDGVQLRVLCKAQCDLEDQNEPVGRVPLKTHYEWDLLRDFCLEQERICRGSTNGS